jgi:hypothetical protein
MKTKLTINLTTKVVCDNCPTLENISKKTLIITFGDFFFKGLKKKHTNKNWLKKIKELKEKQR